MRGSLLQRQDKKTASIASFRNPATYTPIPKTRHSRRSASTKSTSSKKSIYIVDDLSDLSCGGPIQQRVQLCAWAWHSGAASIPITSTASCSALARIGVKGIGHVVAHDWRPEQWQRCRDAVEAQGYFIGEVTLYHCGWPLASPDPAIRREASEFLSQGLHAARALKARCVGVHYRALPRRRRFGHCCLADVRQLPRHGLGKHAARNYIQELAHKVGGEVH